MHSGQASVLIVDRLDDTREVLATALKRRGLLTYSASRADEGLELARRHQPDLIVLDLELEPEDGGDFCAPFAHAAGDGRGQLMLLGGRCRRNAPAGEHVGKPYHYAPLVRKIEQLLAAATHRSAQDGAGEVG